MRREGEEEGQQEVGGGEGDRGRQRGHRGSLASLEWSCSED